MITQRTGDKLPLNTLEAEYLQHVFNSCSKHNKGCDGCRWRLRCQKYYDRKV